MKYSLLAIDMYQKYFVEIMQMFKENLTDSDFSKEIHYDVINIVFGANNYSPLWEKLPNNSIIVNLEQLHENAPCLNDFYLKLLKKYTVWDYSQSNIEFLKKYGVAAQLFNIGWSESMIYKKINNDNSNDIIDVLFLGSLNERRKGLYNKLLKHPKLKNKNIVFRDGVWGSEKQRMIESAKIILNIHFYGEKILETVRISPLLANGKLVISEQSYFHLENEEWNNGPVLCHLDEIPEKIVYFLENPREIELRSKKGKDFFKNKKVILPVIRSGIPKLLNSETFYFYPEQDSIGGDLKHLPNFFIQDVENQLKSELQSEEILAFNTLGYFKNRLNGITNNPYLHNGGIYVKPLDLTFTITTCKRLKHFLTTMDDFLQKCKDHFLIKEWLCVDDGSSEEDCLIMKNKYPFFKFIHKSSETKGHANSMNIIGETIKTKYVLQYEDDWELENYLWISDLYNEIRNNDKIIQIKLLNEHETPIYGKNNGCINVKSFNPLGLNNLNQMFHREFIELSKNTKYHENLKKQFYQQGEYWWPGFTLNPSLYRKDLLSQITPWEQRQEFEFLQGAKVFFKGFQVKVWTNCRCLHLGNDISAYDLNGFSRK